jgi:Zn-dependent metalloprotease
MVVAIAASVAPLALAPAAVAQAPAVDAALRPADAPRAQLETAFTHTLPGGAVVSQIEQVLGEVPVQSAGAVVVDPVDEPPKLLFDESRAGLDAPGEPGLSRAEAIEAAGEAIELRARRGAPSARLVIVPGGSGTLAWEVLVPAWRPFGDLLVTLDASSGAPISRHDLIRRATGAAKLFNPNPVVAQGKYKGLRDRRDRNSRLLARLREWVDLENLRDGQRCLKGKYAAVRESEKERRVCEPSLDWTRVKRANPRFEALMAYHHIDRAQEYIQTLDLEPINEERQEAVANPDMPRSIGQDNSFYSPARDELRFGRGGVDDAEDADVIVHEYGHAVQDAQNPGAFRGFDWRAGAQGEGFGDYLAAAYSTEVAGFDEEWTPCIMEWDATAYDVAKPSSPGICLRRADNPNTRTQQRDNVCGGTEIHCMGEVWSSALLELRALLGDDAGGDSIMDTVVLASHEMLPPSPTFNQAGVTLIEADEQIYEGDHCTEIRAELVQRELLQASYVCPP